MPSLPICSFSGAKRLSRLLILSVLCIGMTACVQFQTEEPVIKPPQTGPDTPPPYNTAPDVSSEDIQSPDQTQVEEFVLNKPDGAEDKPTIALLLPLGASDPGLRKDAAALQDAAMMALFDRQASDINLIPVDTKGTADGAEQAAREAIGRGADIILGPLLSQSVNAVAPVTRQAGVPVLSFSNNERAAGDGIYVIGITPYAQLERLISYSLGKGLTRFAVLAPDDAYGNRIVSDMQQVIGERGGEISRLSFYNPVGTDFTDQARAMSNYDIRRGSLKSRIKALEARNDEVSRAALAQLRRRDTLGGLDFEAILLPTLDPLVLRSLAAQLAQYDVSQPEVRILGLSLWDEFGDLSSEPPLVGSWYVAPPDDSWRLFAERYRKTYSHLPPTLAALAYEATALAILSSHADTPFSRDSLVNPQGYQGILGVFRLTAGGHSHRGLAIKQITDDGVQILDPAPTSFEAAIN